MPSKLSISKTEREELETLRKKSAEQAKEIELEKKKSRILEKKAQEFEQKAQERDQDTNRKRLIPKPDGQDGRADGYNLVEAVGLQSEYVNILRQIVKTIAAKYLDPTLSISKQDKEKMRLSKQEILKVAPIFEEYSNAWPIYAITKRFLGNSSTAYEKAVAAIANRDDAPDINAIKAVYGKPVSKKRKAAVLDDGEDEDPGERQKKSTETRATGQKTDSVGASGPAKSAGTKRSRATANVPSNPKAPTKAPAAQSSTSKALAAPRPNPKPSTSKAPISASRPSTSKVSDTPRAPTKLSESAAKKQSAPTLAVTTSTKTSNTPPTNPKMSGKPAPQKAKDADTKKKTKAKTVASKKLKAKSKEDKAVEKGGGKGSADMTVKKAPRKRKAQVDESEQFPEVEEPAVDIQMPAAKRVRLQYDVDFEDSDEDDTPLEEGERRCPTVYCKDRVSAPFSEHLTLRFKCYDEKLVLREKGLKVKDFNISALLVCHAITQELEIPKETADALMGGWPKDINFEGLTARILAHKEEIISLIDNDIVLRFSPAWKNFLQRLVDHAITFNHFNRLRDDARFAIMSSNAHAGYYGPMGMAIINSALGIIFSDKDDALLKLRSTLMDIFTSALSQASEAVEDSEKHAADWCYGADANQLGRPALIDFFEFILMPYVADLLIIEDLKVGEEEAEKIRVQSKRYGERLHDNADDGRLDDITMKNANLAAKGKQKTLSSTSLSVPGRYSRKENVPVTMRDPSPPLPLLSSNARTVNKKKPTVISMADYPPPVTKPTRRSARVIQKVT